MSEAATSLMLLLVLLPLLCAGAMAFSATHSTALRLAPWTALPVLIQVVFAPPDTSLHLPWLLLGTELGIVDDTSRLFLLFTALLWWLAGMYARSYLIDQPDRSRFFMYFLLAMTGNLGLILAQDLASFYVFFALMSFASYGLVVHERSVAALRAGRVYMVLVVIGEVALFAAMVMAASAAGSIEFDAVRHGLAQAKSRDLIMLLAFTGFGIKAGVLGLHVWLPLAHPVAPTPASAVLSGAMIKAGLLGWLRLFPLGEVALLQWGQVLMIMGLIAAFYGVVVGITQRQPKSLLAYSSISQMGIMTMAVGLGLLAPHAWPVILPTVAFYALHHALSKAALFMGVGLNGSHNHLQRLWVWLGLWLPALALVGAPWTSGMYAKLLLKTQTLYAPTPWDSLLPVLLSASAFATALLMARLLYLIRPAAQPSGVPPVSGLVWPWLAALVSVMLVPLSLLPPMAEYGDTTTMASLWPVILAIFVSMIVLHIGLFRTAQPLPAGDVLVLMERGVQGLHCIISSSWFSLKSVLNKMQQELKSLWRLSWPKTLKKNQRIHILGWGWQKLGGFVGGWSTTITLFVLLGLALGWLPSIFV